MVVDGLPDSNESGQGITDDRQPKEAKPGLRKARKLKRKRRHLIPIHEPGQGARHQKGNGERAVFAVAGTDRLGEFRRRLSEMGMKMNVGLGQRDRETWSG